MLGVSGEPPPSSPAAPEALGRLFFFFFFLCGYSSDGYGCACFELLIKTLGYAVVRRAVVEELAKFGASVHTCSRTPDELDRCLHEWKGLGFRATGSVCDVTSRVGRERLVETVSSIFHGSLSILVSRPVSLSFLVFFGVLVALWY